MKRMIIRTAALFLAILNLAAGTAAGENVKITSENWTYSVEPAAAQDPADGDSKEGKKVAVIHKYTLSADTPEILRVPDRFQEYPVEIIKFYSLSNEYSGSDRIPTPRVLILPDEIREIETGAISFSDLEEIRIENGTTYETVDGVLFLRDQHKLVTYPSGKKDVSYTVPEGTEIIGERSFDFTNVLEEIHIPDSVRLIEEKAFYTIPSFPSVTVYIPKSIEKIMPGAFEFTGFKIVSDSPWYQVTDEMLIDTRTKTLLTFTSDRFSDVPKSYSIPEGVETIGKHAFVSLSCDRVDFPSTLKTIEDDNKFSLQSEDLNLPEGLEKIGDSFLVTGVKDVVFPASLKSVGNSFIFSGNNHLETVFFRDGIESIGDWSFAYSQNLRTVYLPETLKAIGNGVFYECPNLQVFGWPDTAAETYCKENEIPFQCVFEGTWQAEETEAGKALNLPGAKNIKIRLDAGTMELTYTLEGTEHREVFPIHWADRQMNMDGGYMKYSLQDLNHMILEPSQAQLHLTRMGETEPENSDQDGQEETAAEEPENSDQDGQEDTAAEKPEPENSDQDGQEDTAAEEIEPENSDQDGQEEAATGETEPKKSTPADQQAKWDFITSRTYSRESGIGKFGLMCTLTRYRLSENTPEFLSVPSRIKAYDGSWAEVKEISGGCFVDQETSAGRLPTPRVIFLHEGIREIGTGAFRFSDLEKIRYQSGTGANGWRTEDGVLFHVVDGGFAFSEDGSPVYKRTVSQLFAYPRGKKDRSYTIPEDIKGIGSYAFYAPRYLEELYLPDSVRYIEENAFVGEENDHPLTVCFPASNVRIAPGAFTGFPNLQAIGWPGSEAEKYCQKEKIPFRYFFAGLWQADSPEAEKTLNLPGAENIRIRLDTETMELIYTLDGEDHRETYPIQWQDGRLTMGGGYMDLTISDTEHMILDLNEAQMHLTRVEEKE